MHLDRIDARIYVAGHRGLVGSAIVRRLEEKGFTNLILRNSQDLDLRDRSAVNDFFEEEKPDFVIVAAAKVGGILANSEAPVQFLEDNLLIELNVIHSAYESDVDRLLFLGSSCVYPKHAPQPLKEEYLLSGPLEDTNQWYAVAKIAGIKLCEAYHRQYGADFISAMPTNLYGPFDNFDLRTSHVLPALIRKFHEAKETGDAEAVEIWGTGTPRREFLYVDDLADACIFLLGLPEDRFGDDGKDRLINVGTGTDLSIAELVETVRRVVGSSAEITYDLSKPDGTPRKLMDVSRLASMGWSAETGLEEGIRRTYEWYCDNEVGALS